MTLYTKSVYAPVEHSDGIRICVMSRLTQNDGITVVTNLLFGKKFDYWAKILAPPDKVVGAWYRKEIDWDDFTGKYKSHLYSEKVLPHLDMLAYQALEHDITLLCVEDTPELCHRKILAEECQSLQLDLEVIIK